MRGIRPYCATPSASEIAAVTANTPSRFSAEVARKAVPQDRGPKLPPGSSSTWTIPSVTTEHSRNCARLNASLTERCFLVMTSARPAPSSRATMYSAGGRKNSPYTTGISLIENECALRPMWRWTTFASVA